MMSYTSTTWNLLLIDTVDAEVSGHPQDVKKVSVTGADHLWEYRDTEFVLELTTRRFCEGGLKESCPTCLRECPLGELIHCISQK